MSCLVSYLVMTDCGVHGKLVWCTLACIEILSDDSVESKSGSMSACGDAWMARKAMLASLGRPSIMLVMRAMTTGVWPLTLVMRPIVADAGWGALHMLVMGVVLPSLVRMPRMLTVCVVHNLIVAASFLGQYVCLSIRLLIVVASVWLPGTVRVWSSSRCDSELLSCELVPESW